MMEWQWSALRASENHDAPTFKKSAPPSIQIIYTTPLIYSGTQPPYNDKNSPAVLFF